MKYFCLILCCVLDEYKLVMIKEIEEVGCVVDVEFVDVGVEVDVI